jgi:hypothetical protein
MAVAVPPTPVWEAAADANCELNTRSDILAAQLPHIPIIEWNNSGGSGIRQQEAVGLNLIQAQTVSVVPSVK